MQGNIFNTKPAQFLKTVILTLIAMSGLRLDLGRIPTRLFLLLIGSLVLWAPVFLLTNDVTTRAFAAAGICWLYYYGGMSLLFKSSVSQNWIDKWGEERAYQGLTVLVGIGFLNQSLAQSFVIASFENTIQIGAFALVLKGIGFLLMLVGFTTKIWATLLTGLDTYYYKDLFLKHVIRHDNSQEGYITTGPYRFFNNPMYGVGNLQAYGAALMALSFEGLVVAGVYQASIYMFYFLVEKPFFINAYVNKPPTLPTI